VIIENVEPGLALQDRSGTVAIMGLGYAVEILREILWIAQAKQCLYWGDLDTHGFACLARARHHIPKLKSILMDERTLHENQTMWVHEPSPIVIDAPEILTAAEQAVYEALRDNGWGQGVRLEQERIPPKHVLIALEAAAKEVT